MKKSLFIFFPIIIFFTFSCSGGGGGSPDQNNTDEVIISEKAKVIDDESSGKIENVNFTDNTVTFTTQTDFLNTVQIDDIIVFKANSHLPDGLLAKITKIENTADGKVIVHFERAGLTDVIIQGGFSLQDIKLTPDMIESIETVDEDSPLNQLSSTSTDSLLLNKVEIYPNELNKLVVLADFKGAVIGGNSEYFLRSNIDMSFDNDLKIADASIKYLRLAIKFTGELDYDAFVGAGAKIEYGKLIGSIKFTPIVKFVGIIPIYIRPVIELHAGISAQADVAIQTDAKRKIEARYGIEYDNGNVDFIKESKSETKEYDLNQKKSQVGATLKASIKPRLVLYFYGVVGPYGELDGYGQVKVFTPQPSTTEWCELGVGLDVNIGLTFGTTENFLKDDEKFIKFGDLFYNYNLFYTPLYKCKDPFMLVDGGHIIFDGPIGGPFENMTKQNGFTIYSTGDNFEYTVDDLTILSNPWIVVDYSGADGTYQHPVKDFVGISLNEGNAKKLSEGTYTAEIFIKNTSNNNQPPVSKRVFLIVRKPGFFVYPIEPRVLETFNEGQTVSNPNSIRYVLKVDKGTVSWKIKNKSKWLKTDVSSGTVSAGNNVLVNVSIDPIEASKLKATTHKGVIEFEAVTQDGKVLDTISRTIYIQAKMNVDPTAGISITYPYGVDSYPTTSYPVVGRAVNDEINFKSYVNQDWMRVNGKKSESGAILAGASKNFEITFDSKELSKLSKGSHTGTLIVKNLSSGMFLDEKAIKFTVNINDPMNVSPDLVYFYKQVGTTSVQPSSATFKISTDFDNISFTVEPDPNAPWLDIDTLSGTISKSNPANINVSINSNADNLQIGDYYAKIKFITGSANPTTIIKTVHLNVSDACNTDFYNPIPDYQDLLYETVSFAADVSGKPCLFGSDHSSLKPNHLDFTMQVVNQKRANSTVPPGVSLFDSFGPNSYDSWDIIEVNGSSQPHSVDQNNSTNFWFFECDTQKSIDITMNLYEMNTGNLAGRYRGIIVIDKVTGVDPQGNFQESCKVKMTDFKKIQ